MMARETVIGLLILINTLYSVAISDDLILTLPDGQIQGATYNTSNNKTYYGFRGISYATPPLNELRFEPPQPVQPWVGVRDASTNSKNCISIYYFEDSNMESEDCLYINVYVPSVGSKEKLPVMFWIYGGGFTFGNSSKSFYGPDFLIEQDVIVVTHNYRVGPFGFISTGDKALPGNVGLKDQNLALKWTKQNIKYFGGDPDKITIFGESSGAASAALHLLSHQSTGLFRAAIIQSGSSLCYWAIDNDPKTKAYSIADAIPGGSYGNDTQVLKAFLKTKTVEEIMNATMSSLPISSETLSWPTLEEESDDAFMTESPYELLASGNFKQVPIIIGITEEESLFFFKDLEYVETLASEVDNVPTITIPTNLFQNLSDESAVIEKVRSIYLKNGETFSSNLDAYAAFYSDMKFSRPVIKQAELSSSYVPVYFYQFAYYGRPLAAPYRDGAKLAAHTAELPFLFNDTRVSGTTDTKDVLTQNRVVKLWTNFVKYLNPTPEKSDLFDNLTWPLFNNQNYTYLNINSTLEIRTNIRGNYYSKWNYIYETYGRKPFITF